MNENIMLLTSYCYWQEGADYSLKSVRLMTSAYLREEGVNTHCTEAPDFTPGFLWHPCGLTFSFLYNILWTIVYLLGDLLLDIVRVMPSHYLFSILQISSVMPLGSSFGHCSTSYAFTLHLWYIAIFFGNVLMIFFWTL
jgi:hypothetical protein